MNEKIRVSCLIERYWSFSLLKWKGFSAIGTLINITTQSAEDDPNKLIPVGIVLLDDEQDYEQDYELAYKLVEKLGGTFQSVPIEFIFKFDED